MPTIAVFFVAQLVQEHALPVGALLMPEPCRAVLGCPQLSPEDPVAVLRAVDGLDAPRGVFLLLECYIDTERLVLAVVAFAAADGNFQDVAVLTEELRPAQGFEQFLLADCRGQAGHINQVLLDDPNANKVLAVLLLGLAFLRFFLALFGSSLLLVFLDIRSEFGDSGLLSAGGNTTGSQLSLLLLSDHFPLDGFVIVRPSTCRTEAVHVRPDVVEAKLAYLYRLSAAERGDDAPWRLCPYLVAAGTWPEVAVGEIELLNAERAGARG